MNVTLQQLRYFVAVAEESNFTRAAARSHVSQPALSAQIRSLEERLGVQLLRRTTRRVELTTAGERLRGDVQGVLRDLEEALARARAAGGAGTVRIGFTASTGYEALPLLVAGIESLAPGAEVAPARMTTADLLDAVRAGHADAGLGRELADGPGLRVEPLRAEPLAAAMAAGHRLADRHALSLQDMAEETVLRVPRRGAAGFHDRIGAMFAEAGLHPDLVELAAADAREPLFAHLAAHPDRLFLGPVSMANAKWPGVVFVPVEDPEARLRLDLVVPAAGPSAASALAVRAARSLRAREGWG